MADMTFTVTFSKINCWTELLEHVPLHNRHEMYHQQDEAPAVLLQARA